MISDGKTSYWKMFVPTASDCAELSLCVGVCLGQRRPSQGLAKASLTYRGSLIYETLLFGHMQCCRGRNEQASSELLANCLRAHSSDWVARTLQEKGCVRGADVTAVVQDGYGSEQKAARVGGCCLCCLWGAACPFCFTARLKCLGGDSERVEQHHTCQKSRCSGRRLL